MGTQQVRRSQFVLTFGPGAMIEGKTESRIIPSLERGLENFGPDLLKDFDISDARLTRSIKLLTGSEMDDDAENVKVFALPSNASLRKPDTIPLYRTYKFPAWRRCFGIKSKHPHIIYNALDHPSGCPRCGSKGETAPIRFVAACNQGHLDEVPWVAEVHQHRKTSCEPKDLLWQAAGSSLSDVKIVCPDCHLSTTVSDIYSSRKIPCTGRLPEKEEPDKKTGYSEPKRRGKCSAKMRVILRQAVSLRLPQIITLLTIPEFDDAISTVLQIDDVAARIDALVKSYLKIRFTDEAFTELIEDSINPQSGAIIKEFIEKNGVIKFIEKFDAVRGSGEDVTEFIYDEFDSLKKGAPRTTKNFSISASTSYLLDVGRDVIPLQVFPVGKIRTVTAQLGYYRMPAITEGEQAKRINSHAYDWINKTRWYPGFEGLGEAIFLTFKDGAIPNLRTYGDSYKEWTSSECSLTSFYSASLLYDSAVLKEPLFIWLHTFSHAVIKALSMYTGYSAASLRERVLVNKDVSDGGILIYTTSAGEDGSMGGLTAMASDLDSVLGIASEIVQICSNDPLCSEIRKGSGDNGASCYSCLFISETSCEHGNRWLDRHIVLGD